MQIEFYHGYTYRSMVALKRFLLQYMHTSRPTLENGHPLAMVAGIAMNI
jgi:hypothetical protein